MHKYRLLTHLAAPIIPLWLAYRRIKGKEDGKRIKERYGIASMPRPPGNVVWLHAASVGEANSVLLLLNTLRQRYPHTTLLLTTGTVTSARLMQSRLPAGVIHQYAPIDTPRATLNFMAHWKPQMAYWVESELWPNLVMAADRYHCFMGIVNARMSERSLRRWRKRPQMIHTMLRCFSVIFAQSADDAARLEALGAQDVLCYGNLKFDAALLPCDEGELLRLQKAIGARPLWLAASTHPGEETLAAQAHKLLCATRPDLLTVIVPRHPERGDAIARELGNGWRVAQRSRQQPITADTQIYIADTLGELGLFYRLSELVLMGGSLVAHGGQNPLEPARLSCAILCGPHDHNFAGIYRDMEQARAVIRVKNIGAAAAQLDMLLKNASARAQLQASVKKWLDGKGGATARILDLIGPLFEPRP
jgi:3-deoxy-D-manno-octulosonic-acid transferase